METTCSSKPAACLLNRADHPVVHHTGRFPGTLTAGPFPALSPPGPPDPPPFSWLSVVFAFARMNAGDAPRGTPPGRAPRWAEPRRAELGAGGGPRPARPNQPAGRA